MIYDEYINGYIQREAGGNYVGEIRIDGIDLSPIDGVYFQSEGKNYLWLKRKPIMEYDFESCSFRTRKREPHFEAYLQKCVSNNVVEWKGEFFFMRFKYSIKGVWDTVIGMTRHRLNLFVERLPVSEQTILNSIRENKINGNNSL